MRWFRLEASSRGLFLLFALCLVLYFVNLGRWDLWNPDEPRYGQVAREMVEGGDWILMHSNGRIYPDKPPLFFWLIAFSSFLWKGFTSLSVRFPSALFGTLTVILTFFTGRMFSGSSRCGFFSGLILATSFEFAYLSTRGNIDATLTFFTTASLVAFFYWHRSRSRTQTVREGFRNLVLYGFYGTMALATLTKGPVGFLLPLLVSIVYLLICRDRESLKELKLCTGMLLFLTIVLAWYLPAVWKGGQVYLDETLFRHTIDRYSKGWSHVRPFYYYFVNFPAGFLPWVLFLPGAVLYGFSKRGEGDRRPFLIFITWFAVVFLFFTLSRGKRGLYLLPLYPAASILVGRFLSEISASPGGPFPLRWMTYPLYGLGAVLLAGGAGSPWIVSRKFPGFFAAILPIALLLAGGGVVMFVLMRWKRYSAALLVVAAMMAGGFFYTQGVIFPLVNPYKSAKPISREVLARMQPGERLGLFGGFGTGPYNFYTGIVPIHEIEKKEDLFLFLQSPERVFCLLKHRDYALLETIQEKPSLVFLSRRSVGGDDIVLISNR